MATRKLLASCTNHYDQLTAEYNAKTCLVSSFFLWKPSRGVEKDGSPCPFRFSRELWERSRHHHVTLLYRVSSSLPLPLNISSPQQVVNFFTGWVATTIYTTTTTWKKRHQYRPAETIYVLIAPKHSSLLTSHKISRNITSSQLSKLICCDDSDGTCVGR